MPASVGATHRGATPPQQGWMHHSLAPQVALPHAIGAASPLLAESFADASLFVVVLPAQATKPKRRKSAESVRMA